MKKIFQLLVIVEKSNNYLIQHVVGIVSLIRVLDNKIKPIVQLHQHVLVENRLNRMMKIVNHHHHHPHPDVQRNLLDHFGNDLAVSLKISRRCYSSVRFFFPDCITSFRAIQVFFHLEKVIFSVDKTVLFTW